VPFDIRLSDEGAVRAQARAEKTAAKIRQRKHKGRDLLPSLTDHEAAVEALQERDGRPLPRGMKVKNTTNVAGGLTVQEWDADDGAYLLMIGTHASRKFRVVGWRYGWEVKRPEWLQAQRYWRAEGPLREWTGYLVPSEKDARGALGLDRGRQSTGPVQTSLDVGEVG
jgi:hypothetical protein